MSERQEAPARSFYKIDTHTHSRLSKTFDYDRQNIEQMRTTALKRDIDGFALTEHIHCVGFWDMHQRLQNTYDYHEGVYDLDGIKMFSGAEVTLSTPNDGRIDSVVIATLDDLERLDEAFDGGKLSEGNHPDALSFFQKAKDLNLIRIAAHPYRPFKNLDQIDRDEALKYVSAVEVNGRDYALEVGSEHRVSNLADRHNLPMTGGSDAHLFPQIGIMSTIIENGKPLDLGALNRSFERGETYASSEVSRETASSKVILCKDMKQSLKAIQEYQKLVA